MLRRATTGRDTGGVGSTSCVAQRVPGDYLAILAFVDPGRGGGAGSCALADLLGARPGCVVTHGFGPRFLHSTGQLHKGGPTTGVFLQVVDDTGDELAIPGQPFSFATDPCTGAGDLLSLQERGRRVARSAWRMSARCSSG